MLRSEEQAYTRDSLTGVYSRSLMDEQIQRETKRARRYERPLSLLFLDVDYFKSINDGFGHARGDQILVGLTQLLTIVLRSADLVYRYGGDEFVILLPETDQEAALIVAQRILEATQDTVFEGEPPLTISLSMGIASFPLDCENWEMLVSIADKRHYQAKRMGRNRVICRDKFLQTHPLVDETPRLLERDDDVEKYNQFINELTTNQQGVLEIEGLPGSGRSSFLRHVGDITRLQGFALLYIQGKVGLSSRVYGALNEAISSGSIDTRLPHPALGVQRFRAALEQIITTRGNKGLLVILDSTEFIDSATLKFIQALLIPSGHSPGINQLAVVYTTDDTGRNQVLFAPIGKRLIPLQRTLTLQPLTISAIRIWVRHSLQWEAPQLFLDWLFQQTNGLPKIIRRALSYLVRTKLIHQCSDGWAYTCDLSTLSLPVNITNPGNYPLNNLPKNTAGFIGREAELQDLKQLIQEHPLVTLVSPCGMGKSTLALQAAWESIDNFRDGVFWIPDLNPTTCEVLPEAISRALCLILDTPREKLINFLRGKRILLIFDNFETQANSTSSSSTSFLSTILESAPGVKLLLTSRIPSGLPGETLFQVEGMAYPQDLNDPNPEAYDAVQLFLNLAQGAASDFELAEKAFPQVTRICQITRGIPLGIKLAAGWTQSMLVESIADLLEGNLSLLTARRSDLSPRHRSLYAVVESLWCMLSPQEQMTCARLSLFQGSFNESAAWKIAGASPFFLQALVMLSYLARSTQGRYEINTLLTQYGAEKLHMDDEEESRARRFFISYYLGYLTDQMKDLEINRDETILSDIQQEWCNIQQAWQWAVINSNYELLENSREVMSHYLALRGQNNPF